MHTEEKKTPLIGLVKLDSLKSENENGSISITVQVYFNISRTSRKPVPLDLIKEDVLNKWKVIGTKRAY